MAIELYQAIKAIEKKEPLYYISAEQDVHVIYPTTLDFDGVQWYAKSRFWTVMLKFLYARPEDAFEAR